MTKQKPKFRRTDGHKYSKLGVRRKKLQRYRKSKGGDNKIRLNMKGHVRKVRVGFRTAVNGRNLVRGMGVVRVLNVEDLRKIKGGMIGLVGKIGNKNKMEIAKVAIEKKIELMNLNSGKFLIEIEEKLKEAKEKKKVRNEKKRIRDKKSKEKEKKDKKSDEKVEEIKTNESENKKNESSDRKDKEEANKNLETDIKENAEEKK